MENNENFKIIDGRVRAYLADYLEARIQADRILNARGDRYMVGGAYGADISVQSPDGLDKACFDFASSLPVGRALDIGGGIGAQTLRLAMAGADTVMVDSVDQGQRGIFRNFNIHGVRKPVFINSDVRDLPRQCQHNCPPFDIIYSQRMWSSIPYTSGLALLRDLNSDAVSSADAVFFISAIGLETEIGVGHPLRHMRVEDRFGPYAPDMAAKHGVFGSECLYTLAELCTQFADAGLMPIAVMQSDFGNPKLMAVRQGCSPEKRDLALMAARRHGLNIL